MVVEVLWYLLTTYTASCPRRLYSSSSLWEPQGAFARVLQIDQRGWINEIEFSGWTIQVTQFHKCERGSWFQNGGKWTCAGRCCCDMWLFNERMSTHLKKKEITGEKTTFYSFCTGEQVVTCLLIRVICGESPPVDTGNLWWVTACWYG